MALLRQLHRSGLGAEQQLLSTDGLHSTGRLLVSDRNEVLSPMGEPSRRLFGVGPGTSGWGAGAFARPGTNAAPFRENDALARRILTLLACPNNAQPNNAQPNNAQANNDQADTGQAVPQAAAGGKDPS